MARNDTFWCTLPQRNWFIWAADVHLINSNSITSELNLCWMIVHLSPFSTFCAPCAHSRQNICYPPKIYCTDFIIKLILHKKLMHCIGTHFTPSIHSRKNISYPSNTCKCKWVTIKVCSLATTWSWCECVI